MKPRHQVPPHAWTWTGELFLRDKTAVPAPVFHGIWSTTSGLFCSSVSRRAASAPPPEPIAGALLPVLLPPPVPRRAR